MKLIASREKTMEILKDGYFIDDVDGRFILKPFNHYRGNPSLLNPSTKSSTSDITYRLRADVAKALNDDGTLQLITVFPFYAYELRG